MRRLLTAGVLAFLVGACGNGPGVADAVQQTFDANADDVGQVCDNATSIAASREDLEKQIDDIPADERADIVESMRASDGLPEAVKDYGWSEMRQFTLQVWDECEARGLT